MFYFETHRPLRGKYLDLLVLHVSPGFFVQNLYTPLPTPIWKQGRLILSSQASLRFLRAASLFFWIIFEKSALIRTSDFLLGATTTAAATLAALAAYLCSRDCGIFDFSNDSCQTYLFFPSQ